MNLTRPPTFITYSKTILLISVVTATLAGCNSEGCSDTSSFEQDVIVTGIDKIWLMKSTPDGSSDFVYGGSVPKDLLELRIDMSFSSTSSQQTTNRFNLLDWFISSAQACSPDYSNRKVLSNATDVDLISSSSLGDAFMPGDSLESVFLIEGEARLEVPTTSPVVLMQEYAANGAIPATVGYLLKPQASLVIPEESVLHQFTFSITLDTGEMFTAMSDPILISN